MGIGAISDFGPLLSNPKLLLFGAAAQFCIFITIIVAVVLGFPLADAASIGIIGAADCPTSILVSQVLKSNYIGAIAVAAYSYMALVPMIQPFAIKLVTTKKERAIKMPYNPKSVSKLTRILFPIVVTLIAGLVAPTSVALVVFLMFGNLIRECGVLDSLADTAQKQLANLITLFLGITISFSMTADSFVNPQTLMLLALGLVASVFDTISGVLFAKLLNLFSQNKVNPMVGAAGISAFPLSARVVQKLGLEADNQNFLLMHAVGACLLYTSIPAHIRAALSIVLYDPLYRPVDTPYPGKVHKNDSIAVFQPHWYCAGVISVDNPSRLCDFLHKQRIEFLIGNNLPVILPV